MWWWVAGVNGRGGGLIYSIVQLYQDQPIADLQGDEIEGKDEGGKDGIHLAVLKFPIWNQGNSQ